VQASLRYRDTTANQLGWLWCHGMQALNQPGLDNGFEKT